MPHSDEMRGPAAVQVLERALDKQGLRHTLQRQTILEVVAGIGHPFSAGELTEEVAKADPSIGRASVFRLLQLLRSCSLVERLHGPDAELYTLCLAAGHHHHVTCTVCGRTEAFSLEDDAVVARAVERVGYRMEHHVLQAFGICADCQTGSGSARKGVPL
jgi:Fur family ferric uptake transcriptional regulator